MKPLMHVRTKQHLERYLDSPAHALALHGDQGAGKGYLAQYIAARLLQVETTENHPYVFHLNLATAKAGIDEVRTIQDFLKLRVPGSAAIKRVVILESIDSFGHEAQNALLKTLEEPPQDTVILVTIARREAILPTIHSRVQNLQILAVDRETAFAHFNGFTNDAVSKAVHMSSGMPGLLSALLNDSNEHPLVIAIDRARSLVVMTRQQRLSQVDKLLKDKELTPTLLLDGLYRLVEAGYKQSLQTKSNEQLRASTLRLSQIEHALTDLQQNVQAKLVLSRLFLEF